MQKRSSNLFEQIVIALCGNATFTDRAMSTRYGMLDGQLEQQAQVIEIPKRFAEFAQAIVERVESIEAEAK